MDTRKMLGTGIMAAALALSAACGGGEDPAAPGGGDAAGGGQPRAEAAAAPVGTQAPLPTRPQRIEDRLLTPTASPPEPAAEPTEPESSQAGPRPDTAPQESMEPTVGPSDIAGLVPADPQLTDEVLLQDIYEKIDLDQFALDPEELIEFGGRPSVMEHPLVHEHPFLHLFPSLQEDIMEQEDPRDLRYSPTDRDLFDDISANRNGLINFIYRPWFHPIQPDRNRQWAEYGELGVNPRPTSDPLVEPGPFRFGDNSTKGVLLETVAKLVEEARAPGTEPTQRAWWKPVTQTSRYQDPNYVEPRDWTLEEFLSVSVNHEGSSVRTRDPELMGINMHTTPQVEWEILHPQLPIVRVTVHSQHALPLNPAGEEPGSRPQMSIYSVSFVMSFQNRWTSFQDPNRWLIRFKEDLDLYHAPPWALDESMPYPNYWDDTDYMQHRTIGPVVMTVHEPTRWASSTVLQPGNYSMVPRITEWTAPGHVMTDRQVPTHKRDRITRGFQNIDRPEDQGFRQWPMQPGINAGFPLPGHILIAPSFGPGSELWRQKDMDGYDW